MDMSVTINPNGGEQSPEKTEARRLPRGANASDLDAWLEKVEALGELKRITAEVDPDLEAATITYLVGGEKSHRQTFRHRRICGLPSAARRLACPPEPGAAHQSQQQQQAFQAAWSACHLRGGRHSRRGFFATR